MTLAPPRRARSLQPRQRGARAAHHRHDVDREAGGPALFVVAQAEARGVVDQHVDAAQRLGRGRHPGGDGRRVGEVAGHGVDAVALARDVGARLLERRGAASAHGDVGAGSGELQRDGAADAAAAAGDEHALAIEIESHVVRAWSEPCGNDSSSVTLGANRPRRDCRQCGIASTFCKRTKGTHMLQQASMAGQRILVTGGGTGLGQAMAEQLPARSAPTSRSAAGARRSATRPPRPGARSFPSAASTPSASTSAIAQAVEEMVEALWHGGGLTGLVNNAAGNFIAPTESLSPRAFDAIANIVFHGTLLRHAGGRQALGRRREGRPVASRPAVPQRHEHHRHLGRQRLALRRAVGDEQGRHRRHDQVARGRMGALRHPPERDRRRARSRPKA